MSSYAAHGRDAEWRAARSTATTLELKASCRCCRWPVRESCRETWEPPSPFRSRDPTKFVRSAVAVRRSFLSYTVSLSPPFVVARRKLAWNCGRRSRHYVSPRTSFVLRRKQLYLRLFFTNFEHELFSRCLWVICELCSRRSSRLTLFILLGGRERVTSRINIKHRE